MKGESKDAGRILAYAEPEKRKVHSRSGFFSLGVLVWMAGTIGIVVLFPNLGVYLFSLPLMWLFGFIAAVAGVLQRDERRVIAVICLAIHSILMIFVLILIFLSSRGWLVF